MEKIIEQVFESEHFDAHQDWEVPIPGFYIIAAKDVAKRSLTDFSQDESAELIETIRAIRAAMRSALDVQDVYIFQNEDTSHGFHVWLFPRYEWMERFGKKIESVRPIMQFAQETMNDERHVAQVRQAADKMRAFLATI